MRLREILLQEMWNAEQRANQRLTEPTKIKYIKIHPNVFDELVAEQEKELKENKELTPYIEHRNMRTELKFFGVPMLIDWKIEKWEIVI